MLFCLCFSVLSGQTAYQKTKEYWRGASLQAGIHSTNFFDATYNQRRIDERVKPGIGAQVGFCWVPYPFIVDLTFFHSTFDVEEGFSAYIGDAEDITVSHSGGEGALSLALFPQFKIIQPTIGVGYQYASLGINLSGDEGNRSGIPLSVPVYKVGMFAKFNKVGLRAEYKRSIPSEDQPTFYQLGLSLHLSMEATFGNSK